MTLTLSQGVKIHLQDRIDRSVVPIAADHDRDAFRKSDVHGEMPRY